MIQNVGETVKWSDFALLVFLGSPWWNHPYEQKWDILLYPILSMLCWHFL